MGWLNLPQPSPKRTQSWADTWDDQEAWCSDPLAYSREWDVNDHKNTQRKAMKDWSGYPETPSKRSSRLSLSNNAEVNPRNRRASFGGFTTAREVEVETGQARTDSP